MEEIALCDLRIVDHVAVRENRQKDGQQLGLKRPHLRAERVQHQSQKVECVLAHGALHVRERGREVGDQQTQEGRERELRG